MEIVLQCRTKDLGPDSKGKEKLWKFSRERSFPFEEDYVGTSVKNAQDAGDMDSLPGSRQSPGRGNGISLQYSCLESSMGRGAWWATVHKESDRTEHTHTYV